MQRWTRWKWLFVCMGTALLSGFPVHASRLQGPAIGYVLDMSGDWELSSGMREELWTGQAVPAGGVVSSSGSAQRGDYIVVVLFDNTALRCQAETASVLCTCQVRTRGNACPEPLELPETLQEDLSFYARVKRVLDRFGGQPRRYVSTMSRGSGGLREAIVRLDAHGADLRPVMENKRPGVYRLYVRRLGASGASPVRVMPATVDWDPGADKELVVAGLKQGTYELRTSDPSSGSFEPSLDNALFVVTTLKRFEAFQSKFDEARVLVRQWGVASSEDAARNFLRTYLTVMDQENGAAAAEQGRVD